MASALEQSFADICEKHGLLNFSLTARRDKEGSVYFDASCQWADENLNNGRGVVFHATDSIASAIAGAFEIMAAKRARSTVLANEPLPVEA